MSMMKTVALTLAIAGCWSETRKPEPVGPQANPKPISCPSPPVLAELAIAAWDDEALLKRRPDLDVLCIPFRRDHKTYWWLEGPASQGEQSSYIETGSALIDDLRSVVWSDRSGGDSFGYHHMEGEAADLDGDGNDEVLYERMTGEGGMTRSELVVVSFTPAPRPALITLGMSGDGGDYACRGEWSLQPYGRGKLIDVTRTGNACVGQEAHERLDAQGQRLPGP
jgi:hypothetical protein